MAGIAGMVQVAGIVHLLNGQLSKNYGYTAIIVAWLARLHPIAVLVVSVLFGALVNGGYAVSQEGIPQALGAVLQGTILFFVLGIGDVFTRYRLRIVHQRASAGVGDQRAALMTSELLIAICLAAIASGTSILLPALGETLTERSGVQNLGVEGMMLMGALFGYIVDIETENIVLAFVAAMVAAMALALIHAFLSVTLRANQIVSGPGGDAVRVRAHRVLGKPFVGAQAPVVLTRVPIPGLSQIPVLGPILFTQDPVVYAVFRPGAAGVVLHLPHPARA